MNTQTTGFLRWSDKNPFSRLANAMKGFGLIGSKYIEEETIAYLFSDNIILLHQNRLDRLKTEPADEVLKDVKVKQLPFPARPPLFHAPYTPMLYQPAKKP